MDHCNYQTDPMVCSRNIEFEIEDGIIRKVLFSGGCHGNLQGIKQLIKGMSMDDVISKLSGIKCGDKSTSCPDQLAKCLDEIKTNLLKKPIS